MRLAPRAQAVPRAPFRALSPHVRAVRGSCLVHQPRGRRLQRRRRLGHGRLAARRLPGEGALRAARALTAAAAVALRLHPAPRRCAPNPAVPPALTPRCAAVQAHRGRQGGVRRRQRHGQLGHPPRGRLGLPRQRCGPRTRGARAERLRLPFPPGPAAPGPRPRRADPSPPRANLRAQAPSTRCSARRRRMAPLTCSAAPTAISSPVRTTRHTVCFSSSR